MKVAIIKYDAGNIYSVVNALQRLNVTPILTDDAEELLSADRVLFPGQGEASTTMESLRTHNLDKIIPNLNLHHSNKCQLRPEGHKHYLPYKKR